MTLSLELDVDTNVASRPHARPGRDTHVIALKTGVRLLMCPQWQRSGAAQCSMAWRYRTGALTLSSSACEIRPFSFASSKYSVCIGVLSGISITIPLGAFRFPAISEKR